MSLSDQQLGLLAFSLVATLVTMTLVGRSRWAGPRLMVAASASLWSTMALLPTLERAWFAQPLVAIPDVGIPSLLQPIPLVIGLVTVAALVLGRGWHADQASSPLPLPTSAAGWAARLVAAVGVYVMFMLGPGAVVAWRHTAIWTLNYRVPDPVGLAPERLLPATALLGLGWLAVVALGIRMTRGTRGQVALVMALVVALPPSLILLLPSAEVETGLRLAHFAARVVAYGVFAVVATWLLTRSERAGQPSVLTSAADD